MSRRKGQEDCSGAISAVAFGAFCVLGSLFLFYLISGPPTFLDVVTLSPGDTVFHQETWSRLWCECIQFESFNNRSLDDVSLYRFPADTKLPLSVHLSYSVSQNVSDPVLDFEYWEAYFHPGASARACFSFSEPVDFFFAPRYYVDGEERDPDFQDHASQSRLNVTSGCVEVGNFTDSGGWAFVWSKGFKTQQQTVGSVQYVFNMVEYAVPQVNASQQLKGEGRFCWATDAAPDAWLVAARQQEEGHHVSSKRLEAHLWCVPRYVLSIPITAIPVAIAAVLEILIIVFCICKPHRAAKRGRYEQI